LLEILVSKILVRKFIFSPGFLPRLGARYEHLLSLDINLGPKIMTMFAGLAEFEHDLIGDRTSAGHEAARRQGIQLACLRKYTYEHVKLGRRLLNERKFVREITDTLTSTP
jgi:hypothetical protein